MRESFKSTLQIVSFDREGLLADVTVQLSNMHVMIHSANAREQKDKRCIINITISVNGVEHLKNVISRLSKISGLLSVRARLDEQYDDMTTMAFVQSVANPSNEASLFISELNALIAETTALYNQRMGMARANKEKEEAVDETE